VGVIAAGRLLTESTVADMRGQASLLVRADPMSTAREVAMGLVGAARVTAVDGTLRLSIGTERAAELNRTLVLAGVEVSEVRPLARTLEDAFFEMTNHAETNHEATNHEETTS